MVVGTGVRLLHPAAAAAAQPVSELLRGQRRLPDRRRRRARARRAGQRRRRPRRRDRRHLAAQRPGRDPHGDRPLQADPPVPRRQRRAGPQHAAEGHGGRHPARPSRRPDRCRTAATIAVGQTTSPIDSDELLASLDGDTRAWFTSLITELSAGTRGRGQDIRGLLRSLGPTAGQLRQIGDLLAGRRQELAADRPQPGRAHPGHQRQGRAADDGRQGRRRHRRRAGRPEPGAAPVARAPAGHAAAPRAGRWSTSPAWPTRWGRRRRRSARPRAACRRRCATPAR